MSHVSLPSLPFIEQIISLTKKEPLSSPLASLSLYLILTAKLSLFPLLLPLHQLVRKSIFLQRLPSGCESLNRYHIDFVFNLDADLITKKKHFYACYAKSSCGNCQRHFIEEIYCVLLAAIFCLFLLVLWRLILNQ